MRVIHGLSALALVACASLAFAQNVREAEAPARPAAGARPAVVTTTTQAWTADQQIAATLYNCCRNDVEISKFALERIQSPEVKQFCEQMIAEHTTACEKLQKAAGPALASYNNRLDAVPGEARPGRTDAGRPEAREERREGREDAREERREEGAGEAREERREGREDAREARREADADAPRPATRPARAGEAAIELKAGGDRTRPEIDVRLERGGAAGGLNWVAIHKQIADQCLATTKKEFGEKEPAELEKCYLGSQIMGHMKAMDEIKVLRNYASAEFRAELDACSEKCAEHLKEAKVLAKKLESEAGARVSRKPADATETTKPE